MSLNKVMLIGNVGKEPDVRYLDNGVAVASLTLATTERGYRLQNGTDVPERTEWHNIVLFIEGKIRSRSYDDQNGVKRYITEIFADNMEMLSPRNQAGQVSGPSVSSSQSASAQVQGGKEDLPF